VQEQVVTVSAPRWARTGVWLLLPAIGGALGWLLDRYLLDRGLDWLSRWPWPVMRGPLKLLADLPEPQTLIGALTLGTGLGLVFAYLIDRESLTVRLSRTEVTLSRPGTTRTLPRADIAVAFADGDQLVLLGRTGKELAREPSNLSPRRFAAEFAAHGVAWSDHDPYADSYRRWVPGLPEIPETAHALFAARQKAIGARDERDVADLRDELARLGFVVRDEHRRQFWRRVS
jgi:hypothetical protein